MRFGLSNEDCSVDRYSAILYSLRLRVRINEFKIDRGIISNLEEDENLSGTLGQLALRRSNVVRAAEKSRPLLDARERKV